MYVWCFQLKSFGGGAIVDAAHKQALIDDVLQSAGAGAGGQAKKGRGKGKKGNAVAPDFGPMIDSISDDAIRLYIRAAALCEVNREALGVSGGPGVRCFGRMAS